MEAKRKLTNRGTRLSDFFVNQFHEQNIEDTQNVSPIRNIKTECSIRNQKSVKNINISRAK
jgi:hypothetical protein